MGAPRDDRSWLRSARWPLAIAAVVALGVVVRCGYSYPYSDDWDLVVPILSGQRPITLSWLWAQHNEHRIAIPKLVLFAADTLARGDFRGGVVANWALLVVIAAALSAAVRRAQRSASIWPYIAISALALHPANNALRWGVEGQFVLSALLMLVAVAGVLLPASTAAVACAGVPAVLLPMTGGNGVLFSVAAALATAYCGLRASRPRDRALALALVALTAIVIALYFDGYVKPANHEALQTQSFVSGVVVFVHLILAPFGPACSRLAVVTGPVAVVALAYAGARAWRACRADRQSRPLVVAIALTATGTFLVFGAIAFSRGARGWPPGLETHYASLGIPLWGMVLVGLAAFGGRTAPLVIGVVTAAAFAVALPLGPPPPYVAAGEAFRRDWCSDVPPATLAERYMRLFYYVDTPPARSEVALKLTALKNHPPASWRCGTMSGRGAP